MIRVTIAIAASTALTLSAPAQEPPLPSKPVPAAPAGTQTGPNIRPAFDLAHTTVYTLQIKGARTTQSSKGLMDVPVELAFEMRVSALSAPTETAEGEIDIEFVTVKYFANEKTGNISFDSTKPPRSKPGEHDRSKPAFTESSQSAADEFFQKVVGSHAHAFVNTSGKIVRFSTDQPLAGQANMPPFIPPVAPQLRLLLGPAGTNSDPNFAGAVRDRVRWTCEENIGTEAKPVIVETGYEVRGATASRVEIATLGKLKSDSAQKNRTLHVEDSVGTHVWDPKAGQLVSARVTRTTEAIDATDTLGSFRQSQKWDVTLQRGATAARTTKAAAPH